MNPLDALGMSYFEVMSMMDINLSTCLTAGRHAPTSGQNSRRA